MSHVKTHSAVRYGMPERPGGRHSISSMRRLTGPSFIVRGWDDGKVFTTVYCTCGDELFDDDTALSENGTVRIECKRCKVVYSIFVMCGVAGT